MSKQHIPTLSTDEMKFLAYAIIGFLVILFLYKFGSGILMRLGLTKSETEKKAENIKTTIATTDILDPKVYLSAPANQLMSSEIAKSLAKAIDNAMPGILNWVTDDEEIIAVIKQLKNKYQASQLADVYFKNYGEDFGLQLKRHLSNSNLIVAYEILNNL